MTMIDKKIREYLLPERILWETGGVKEAESLLRYNSDQAFFGGALGCVLEPGAAVLLDFGKELSGGVRIVCNECSGRKNARIRITFGESAMEALQPIGCKNATNDHAVRDEELTVPWVGELEYGNTGFRFVRIENKSTYSFTFRQVFAVYVHCNAERIGEFRCSDERLDRIWEVGAHTVFLNMQDYVYDGVKRDRVVWIGDMHPETSAILRLFGADERVERSLEFVRDNTPPSQWMNAIPSYSMWWMRIVYDYWLYTGKESFIRRQIPYVRELSERFAACVDANGDMAITDRFIDWPSSGDAAAQTEGVRALLKIALECAVRLLETFGTSTDTTRIAACEKAADSLCRAKAKPCSNKQAAALSVLAELSEAEKTNESLFSVEPLKGLSSFLGYYVLQARSRAGDTKGALDLVRGFWGKMVELGATTFWEDFNIDWAEGAKPIDTVLASDEYDVHGDNGGYCYSGYRHSLCHGWAAGPVPFLSECVLGIRVLEAGCKRVEIAPDLGDLQWAEGAFPTPYGPLWVRHERVGNAIRTDFRAPKEVECIVRTKGIAPQREREKEILTISV